MKEQLYERKIHGSRLFPFQHYNANAQGGSIFVPYHWHDDMEIILVLNGRVSLLLDGNKYELQKNDLYFINPGQLHQFSSLSDDAQYYAYVFSLESLEFLKKDTTQALLIQSIGKNVLYPVRLLPEESYYEEVLAEIKQIIKLNEQVSNAYEIMTVACLYKIIGYLAKGKKLVYEDKDSKRYRNQKVRHKELISYIQNHYNSDIRLEEIAKIVHVSPQYFCTYFSNLFGISFINYLNKYRIEQAGMLLLTTDLTITEIGLLVGFGNTSYFIKKFKEYTMMTPLQYRRIEDEIPIQGSLTTIQ